METAAALAEAVRAWTISPVQAVEGCLARIDALDSKLQAWVEVDREGALRQARALAERVARGEDPGPLAGVPVGIKDIVDVAGLPTRLGAGRFAHYTPETDAACVARLRRAGAVIVGKTHTTEFAYLDPAPTRNPWNLEHTPGGSSSGSAAAVGAGMLPLAIGSQTVGSVLRPAAYCGIVGFKPTFGRISYAGTASLAPSFDHIGVLCTCVADAALALNALAGHDPADPYSLEAPPEDYGLALVSPKPPRLGLVRSYYRAQASEAIFRHLEDVAELLAKAGARVEEAEMPVDAAAFREAGEPIMRYEAAAVHAQRFKEHRDDYRPGIRSLVEAGQATSEADYRRALIRIRELREETLQRLEGFDAFLFPVAPATAPPSLETTGQGIFCAPASFAGLPAISLPSGLDEYGLPLAVQLMAGHLQEARLFGAAAWVESVLDFRARPSLA
ncbi:MAG TPA: amidase [Dehalococcoidia bacterium]|nr:amidase [Dehalococcoidia bacterium]